ncbi:phospholipid carrier-dependent glycosyltransferase [Shimia sp. SDUM112013]|uniref:phospholipid carrier-dependent glycosyltransferase n=1 Tax=Shimia sp. SDUM112013 TaxID=3136160 RepID=UPI0032EFB30F
MNRKDLGVLAVLFLLGFALRLVGLDWGYFHGDERINDAARVLTGQLVPGQHFYPPLFNYINAVALAGLFGFGMVAGWWADTGAFRDAYFTDPTVFYLTARGVTAAFGATIAPLFYILARCFATPREWAIGIALLGGIAGPAITFSYIAKGDTPLAAATVLTVLAFSLRVMRDKKRYDLWLGLAACLALSFKQSILFFLVPLLIAHVALLAPRFGAVPYLRSLGRSLLVIAVLWPVLNIGILLDFENFVNYQKIQALMSVREGASMRDAAVQWLQLAGHPNWGVGWIILGAFFLYPAIACSPFLNKDLRSLHMALWLCILAGMVITLGMVRDRQPEHLWISYFVLMQFFASFGLVSVIRSGMPALKWIGGGALAASAVLSFLAVLDLWGQARAVPMSRDLTALLQRDHAAARILSLPPVDAPQHPEAQAMSRERITRLARKYEVEMPEEAARDAEPTEDGKALFWVPTPAVMFGLENATDEEMRDLIRPHAWPLQPEEWQLDYWLDEGFSVFVVSNLPYMLNETPSLLFRAFWGEIASRCEVAHTIAARKPLFLERDVTAFQCQLDS